MNMKQILLFIWFFQCKDSAQSMKIFAWVSKRTSKRSLQEKDL